MTAPEAGRYEPLLELGSGGMATVFVGRARGAAGFSRLVALKRARAHVDRDASLFAALEREARLASRIHHSNVVAVLDVVEDEGDLVLVLEYVEGVSLAELGASGQGGFAGLDVRTRARAIVRIILDVAAGLHAAHRTEDEAGRLLGIVHRDVSPSNVLVGTDGISKIADFGIAKSLDAPADRTDSGGLKGKVGYMAPEYIEHHTSAPSVDLFALAVVAWESLTGARLFRSATEIETLKRVVAGRVPDLGAIAPELAPLDPVLRRALAVRPDERHASIEAFASELESVARAVDLVASHAEVASIVDRVAGAALSERRRLLDQPAGRAASRPPPAGRDDVATASIPGAGPRPSRRQGPESSMGPSPASRESEQPTRRLSQRGRPLAVGAAIVVLATAGVALVASSGRSAPAVEASGPASSSPAGPSATVEIATAASSAPPPATRGAPSSAPARKAPSRVLVPRKAPPNPYLR